MKGIYTIGYEGAGIDDFLEVLKANKIRVLLDVREIPVSRRKGFSKTALAAALTDAGLVYRHEKSLGSPKDMRHKLRADGDYKAFFSAFEQYLKTQDGLLHELSRDLKGNVALMCYEKDPLMCHRRTVAKRLGEIVEKKPKHIGVKARNAPCVKNTKFAYS